MRAALLRLGREPGRLERLLDPGVAASAAALAVPRMKVLGAPTQMPPPDHSMSGQVTASTSSTGARRCDIWLNRLSINPESPASS